MRRTIYRLYDVSSVILSENDLEPLNFSSNMSQTMTLFKKKSVTLSIMSIDRRVK